MSVSAPEQGLRRTAVMAGAAPGAIVADRPVEEPVEAWPCGTAGQRGSRGPASQGFSLVATIWVAPGLQRRAGTNKRELARTSLHPRLGAGVMGWSMSRRQGGHHNVLDGMNDSATTRCQFIRSQAIATGDDLPGPYHSPHTCPRTAGHRFAHRFSRPPALTCNRYSAFRALTTTTKSGQGPAGGVTGRRCDGLRQPLEFDRGFGSRSSLFVTRWSSVVKHQFLLCLQGFPRWGVRVRPAS